MRFLTVIALLALVSCSRPPQTGQIFVTEKDRAPQRAAGAPVYVFDRANARGLVAAIADAHSAIVARYNEELHAYRAQVDHAAAEIEKLAAVAAACDAKAQTLRAKRLAWEEANGREPPDWRAFVDSGGTPTIDAWMAARDQWRAQPYGAELAAEEKTGARTRSTIEELQAKSKASYFHVVDSYLATSKDLRAVIQRVAATWQFKSTALCDADGRFTFREHVGDTDVVFASFGERSWLIEGSYFREGGSVLTNTNTIEMRSLAGVFDWPKLQMPREL